MNIPKECYKHTSGEEQIYQEMQGYKTGNVEIESINFEGSIYLNIKDAPYPIKTCVTEHQLWSANMMKSVLMGMIKLSPFPNRDKFIDVFIRLGEKIMSPALLKEEHLSVFARELHWCVFTFLVEVGVDEVKADKVAEIFVHLIEFDNAYRYRLLDIFYTTSKEKLSKPITELQRIIKMIEYRDNYTVSVKFKLVGRLILLALLLPKYRRAFKKVVDGVDLKNLQPDDGDKYWMYCRSDYRFFNLDVEQRMELAKAMKWKYPWQ